MDGVVPRTLFESSGISARKKPCAIFHAGPSFISFMPSEKLHKNYSHYIDILPIAKARGFWYQQTLRSYECLVAQHAVSTSPPPMVRCPDHVVFFNLLLQAGGFYPCSTCNFWINYCLDIIAANKDGKFWTV